MTGHIPWHIKYRPQHLDDLIGQPLVARTLKNAVSSDKIPNAFLFSGTKGSGKTSAARILATSLSCLKSDKPTLHPCGECSNCRGIHNTSSLDVLELDAASHGGVDDIRELCANVHLSRFQSRFRLLILDEVHGLSKQGQNALLKTLEEPPAQVVFVLATTEPNKILDTIASRCIHLRFKKISQEPLVERLSKIAALESVEVDSEALKLLASACGGSLREALQCLEMLHGQRVTVAAVREALELPSPSALINLIASILTGRYADVVPHLHAVLAESTPEIVLREMATGFRELYRALLVNDGKTLSSSGLDLSRLAQIASVDDLELILSTIRDQKHAILNGSSPETWLEILALDLCRLGEF